MSLEAIAAVERAEADAMHKKADAAVESKRILAAAEAAGREAIEAARRKAEEEQKNLDDAAAEKAAAEVAELQKETELKKAQLRDLAGGRLQEAAEKIVERIVNG